MSGGVKSGSSGAVAPVTISLPAPLKRAQQQSAFKPFVQTPASQSAHASASSSCVASPLLKNALAVPSGAVLNELQKLQLDLGDSTTTTASAASSAGLDKQSASPGDAAAVSPIAADPLAAAISSMKIA